jgi:hypothetical protein
VEPAQQQVHPFAEEDVHRGLSCRRRAGNGAREHVTSRHDRAGRCRPRAIRRRATARHCGAPSRQLRHARLPALRSSAHFPGSLSSIPLMK